MGWGIHLNTCTKASEVVFWTYKHNYPNPYTVTDLVYSLDQCNFMNNLNQKG